MDAAGTYSVITYHYGVNAEEIEQSITIPLENLVADLPGIREIRSTSEFGQSRVILRLHGEVDPARFYLALRDRVSRAQARSPGWPRNPRSSPPPGRIDRCSCSVLLDPDRQLPAAGSDREGTEAGAPADSRHRRDRDRRGRPARNTDRGGARKSFFLQHHPALGCLGAAVPAPVRSSRQPAATAFRLPGDPDGGIESLEAVRGLRLPTPGGGSIQLGEIASVSYTHRYPESVSRVDSSQRVVAYVYGGGKANLILLSRTIRNTIRSFRQAGYEVSTIYDQGVRMEEGLREVAVAIGIGILSLTVFLLLLLPNLRLVLLLSLEFPLVVYLSAAVLTALGVSIDRHILVGMAVGNGLIIDISLVIPTP